MYFCGAQQLLFSHLVRRLLKLQGWHRPRQSQHAFLNAVRDCIGHQVHAPSCRCRRARPTACPAPCQSLPRPTPRAPPSALPGGHCRTRCRLRWASWARWAARRRASTSDCTFLKLATRNLATGTSKLLTSFLALGFLGAFVLVFDTAPFGGILADFAEPAKKLISTCIFAKQPSCRAQGPRTR